MDLLTGFIPSNINCFTEFTPSKGDKGGVLPYVHYASRFTHRNLRVSKYWNEGIKMIN